MMFPGSSGVISPFASQRNHDLLSARLSPAAVSPSSTGRFSGHLSGAVPVDVDETNAAVSAAVPRHRTRQAESSRTPVHAQVSMLLSGDEADASDKYDDGESLSSFSDSDNDPDDAVIDVAAEAVSGALDDSTSSVDDFLDKRAAIKQNPGSSSGLNKRQRLINSFREQSQQFQLTAHHQQQTMNYPLNFSNPHNTSSSSASSAHKGVSSRSHHHHQTLSSKPVSRTRDKRSTIQLVIEDYDFVDSSLVVSVGDVLEIILADSVPFHAEHTIYGIVGDETDAVLAGGALMFESPLLQVFSCSYTWLQYGFV
jgi:hypothetical protein